MSDRDLASVVRIPLRAFKCVAAGFVRGGMTSKRTHGIERNILDARPLFVGGVRAWQVERVADFFGVTVERLLAAVDYEEPPEEVKREKRSRPSSKWGEADTVYTLGVD